MPTSDNGWSVTQSRRSLVTIHPKGSNVPFVVRKGTEGLFQELIDFLQTLEPVEMPGWDGGYAYRKTRGSDTAWSTHSSGTGIDWNASQHPRGVRNTWSLRRRLKIRQWLASPVGKAFKWGADFRTTPDDMHFQLQTPAVVAAVKADLARARAEQEAAEKVRPQPVKPKPAPPKEEQPVLILHFRKTGPEKDRAYQVYGNAIRYVDGNEVTQLRQAGVKVVFVALLETNPVWRLPTI